MCGGEEREREEGGWEGLRCVQRRGEGERGGRMGGVEMCAEERRGRERREEGRG